MAALTENLQGEFTVIQQQLALSVLEIYTYIFTRFKKVLNVALWGIHNIQLLTLRMPSAVQLF